MSIMETIKKNLSTGELVEMYMHYRQRRAVVKAGVNNPLAPMTLALTFFAEIFPEYTDVDRISVNKTSEKEVPNNMYKGFTRVDRRENSYEYTVTQHLGNFYMFKDAPGKHADNEKVYCYNGTDVYEIKWYDYTQVIQESYRQREEARKAAEEEAQRKVDEGREARDEYLSCMDAHCGHTILLDLARWWREPENDLDRDIREKLQEHGRAIDEILTILTGIRNEDQ